MSQTQEGSGELNKEEIDKKVDELDGAVQKESKDSTEDPNSDKAEQKTQSFINYSGLKNQGATCYMNSYLQMIFMIPEFRKYLFSLEYKPELHGSAEDFIPLQLQLLFAQLQSREAKYVSTKPLTKSFKWDANDSFTQHDIQEFARVLFEALELSFEDDNSENVEAINDLFKGESLNYTKCLESDYESIHLEKWLDLQLIIENQWEKIYNDRLEKSFISYLKPEKLEGSNQYECPLLNKKVDALRGARFFKLPKVLVLNLNRFTYDPHTYSRIKLSNFMSFPWVLNMNRFVSGYETVKDDYADELGRIDKPTDDMVEKNMVRIRQGVSHELTSMHADKKNLPKNLQSVGPSKETKSVIAELKKKLKEDSKSEKDFVVVEEPKNTKIVREEKPVVIGKEKEQPQEEQVQIPPNFPPPPPPPIGLLDVLIQERHEGKFQPPPPQNYVKTAVSSSYSNMDSIRQKQKEQIDEQKNKEKLSDDLLSDRIQEVTSIDIENKIQESLKDGPLVYLLQGVLIHSGSAYSGHYYAYIKSFEDGNWYKFNDDTITPSSMVEIAKDSFSLRYSSSSAYMLFYKQFEQDPIALAEQIPIPEKLVQECKQMLEVQKEEIKKNYERIFSNVVRKDGKFEIKCYYQTESRLVKIDNEKFTLNNLLQKVKTEFKLDDVKDSNFRIRLYKPTEDLMQNTYDGLGDRFVFELGFSPNKCYAIEVKEDHEEFHPYDAEQMRIRCHVWNEDIYSSDFIEPTFSSLMSKNKPVRELVEYIREQMSLGDDEIIWVLRRSVMGDNQKQAILLNSEDQMNKTLSEVGIYENAKVLIEKADRIPMEASFIKSNESRWAEQLEKENYSCVIRYNIPSMHPNSELAQYDQILVCDQRITVAELRKMLSEKIDVEENKFVIKKGGKSGFEIKDLHFPLLKCTIKSNAILYLCYGTPIGPNEMKIKLLYSLLGPEKTIEYSHKLLPMCEIAVDKMATPKEIIDIALTKSEEESELKLQGKSFRLRKRHGLTLTQVFRNCTGISRQQFTSNLQIVVEEIDPVTQFEDIDSQHYLATVQFVDPLTLNLCERFEILMHRTDSFRDIGLKIVEKCNKISLENLEVAKCLDVFKLDNLYTTALSFQKLDDQESLVTKKPYYIINDGVVLVVKDRTVPFRELTEEEKNIKETSGKFSHINDNFNFVELTVSSVSRRKEKGIKIYAKRSDKEKAEREKQEKLEKALEEEQAKKGVQVEVEKPSESNPAENQKPITASDEGSKLDGKSQPSQAFAGEMAGIEDIFGFDDL